MASSASFGFVGGILGPPAPGRTAGMGLVRITDLRLADGCPTRREPSNVDHGSRRHDGLLRARHALGAGGEAVRHSHPAGRGCRAGHGRAGLHARPRRAARSRSTTSSRPTRKSKARQVETYFRTIRNELSQLAVSKMAIDAARGFNAGFDELDRADVPFDLRRKVGDWYETQFMPDMRRVLGKEPNVNDYLPVGPAAYYLQYHYIVANPYPADRRKLLDDAGDGSAYSAAARHLPSAAAGRRHELRLLRPHAGRPQVRPHRLWRRQGSGSSRTSLRTGPYRQSNLAAAVARCGATPDRSAVCLEDFAPYAPSGGAPIAFMAAPVIDQGVVIGVLIAQLSIEEIDNVVTGDRRWRQDGFGATGEAYLVGADHFVRSGPRAFYENRRSVLRRAEAGRRSRTRKSTPSAATARRCCISASRPRPPGPRSPASRAPARSSAIAASRRSPPGGRSRFPASSGR